MRKAVKALEDSKRDALDRKSDDMASALKAMDDVLKAKEEEMRAALK
jgi:hypothetical protein